MQGGGKAHSRYPVTSGMSKGMRPLALMVFRACPPRRGRKAADDRRFLDALYFFTVENVRWRALPKEYGHWNAVWKRFSRMSKTGVFEAFFDTLASMSPSAHPIQMFDSTIVRAHVSAAGAKGGKRVRRSVARAAVSRPKSAPKRMVAET
jgi:transposase